MRNKVKYAGVTAVALLTVAPMITSSLNPIMVKASPVVEAGKVNSKESSEITSIDFRYPAEIDVEEGSLVSASEVFDVSSYIIVSNDGNTLDYASYVSPDVDNYKEYAKDSDLKDIVEMGESFTLENPTLYRRVIVIFDDSMAELINNKSISKIFNGELKDDKIELEEYGFSFIQKINIVKNSEEVNPPVVTPEQPKDVSGIAIVNHENNFYHLYNTNNELIDHRALAANSHWQVDKVRTINGEKQYRVSTNEWIKASDVTFIANAEVNYSMTITPLTQAQQITLDGDGHYRLHNSDMEVSDHRALSGGTSWLVDKIGRDAHGGVYYGVSTNEFIKAGDGVNLVK